MGTAGQLNFSHFPKYTTVGDNSIPNQAALYAGHILESRDGIRSETKQNKKSWIWDDLEQMGYVTFKAEDGCIANSNMVQSIQPNTTHGQTLIQLYCVDFARPNCVGGKHASEYLFNHAKDFIQTYSSSQTPWAAFLSLVDTHEDTMTLATVLDQYLAEFLKDMTTEMIASNTFKNTAVAVLSDHGLHYGPYFQSMEGERERSEPVLYMKIPETMVDFNSRNNYLQSNLLKWITPFDVHKTLLDIVNDYPPENSPTVDSHGSSLIRGTLPFDSCQDQRLIPEHHCELLDPSSSQPRPRDNTFPTPPSILSFYADIPRDHRLKHNLFKQHSKASTLFRLSAKRGLTCKCSTSHRSDLFPCDRHPWKAPGSKKDEYFFLLGCEGFPLHLEMSVPRRSPRLSELRNIQTTYTSKREDNTALPNILYIEVDSVSVEFADRHLPRTRELLKKYRTIGGINGSNEQCHNGICGVEFSKFAINGPSSIPNQVASLSGCFTALLYPPCFTGNPKEGDVCGDPSRPEYGMQVRKIHSWGGTTSAVYCPTHISEPYLYDLAKDLGYFTFFGEEFCYNGSPYIHQDNIFPLKADVYVHQIYCQLRKYDQGPGETRVMTPEGLTTQEWPLEILRQMWTKLPANTPKFAYFNAIAAHDTKGDASEAIRPAEAFDVSLSSFLESIFSADEIHNTVVVVKSDHGSQSIMPIDYSAQIERSRPWTEILVPERFPGLHNLRAVSNQMVTALDLNAMFRRLMTGNSDTAKFNGVYDILNEVVPKDRSCAEAKVPVDFCFEEFNPFPQWFICNGHDQTKASFCHDPYMGTVA